MKKIISIIFAVMLVSALTVTSFAATPLPTIDYVFEGGGYTYVFASTNATADEIDAGLCIVDIYGNKYFPKVSELDSTKISNIAASGKFGFEIITNNMIEKNFMVEPAYAYSYGTGDVRPVTVKGLPHILNSASGTVKKGIEGTPVNYSKWSTINSSSKNSTNSDAVISENSYKLLITFDITTIPAYSDMIYLELPSYHTADQGNKIHDQNYILTVYDTTDNSNYGLKTGTYNNTIGNGSLVVGDKIAKITNKDIFYTGYIAATNNNNSYTGLRVDVTDYIKSKKTGSVTFLIGVDDEDKELSELSGYLYFGTLSSSDTYKFKLVPVNFD